jgi:hypothetical protein
VAWVSYGIFCLLVGIVVYTMLTNGFSGQPSTMPWG